MFFFCIVVRCVGSSVEGCDRFSFYVFRGVVSRRGRRLEVGRVGGVDGRGGKVIV